MVNLLSVVFLVREGPLGKQNALLRWISPSLHFPMIQCLVDGPQQSAAKCNPTGSGRPIAKPHFHFAFTNSKVTADLGCITLSLVRRTSPLLCGRARLSARTIQSQFYAGLSGKACLNPSRFKLHSSWGNWYLFGAQKFGKPESDILGTALLVSDLQLVNWISHVDLLNIKDEPEQSWISGSTLHEIGMQMQLCRIWRLLRWDWRCTIGNLTYDLLFTISKHE